MKVEDKLLRATRISYLFVFLAGLTGVLRQAFAARLSANTAFSLEVLFFSSGAAGAIGGLYAVFEMYFVGGITLRGPNDAERENYRAGVLTVTWAFFLIFSAALMFVTDIYIRRVNPPTPFMRNAGRATAILFAAGALINSRVLRKLDGRRLRPARRSLIFAGTAALCFAGIWAARILGGLPESEPNSVSETINRAAGYLQVLIQIFLCVAGAAFGLAAGWQAGEEARQLRKALWAGRRGARPEKITKES